MSGLMYETHAILLLQAYTKTEAKSWENRVYEHTFCFFACVLSFTVAFDVCVYNNYKSDNIIEHDALGLAVLDFTKIRLYERSVPLGSGRK